MQKLPKNTRKKDDSEKVSYKEFIKISFWVIKLLHKYYPKQTIIFIITSVLAEFRSLVNVYIMAKIIDSAILAAQNGSDLSVMVPYIGWLLLINVLLSINTYFRNYSRSTINIGTSMHLQKELYDFGAYLGIQALESPEINNKFFRTRNEFYGIRFFVRQLVSTLSTFVSFIVYAVIAFKISPIIIGIFLIFEIPFYLYDRKYRKLSWRVDLDTTDERRLASWNSSDLSEPKMLSEILINGAFNFLDNKFTSVTNKYLKKQFKLRRKWFLGNQSIEVLSDGGIYLGYLFPFKRLIEGTITVGTATFQIRSIDQLANKFRFFSSNLSNVFEFSLRLKDSYKLFKAKPAFEDGDKKFPKLDKGPEINIENLDFTYPNAKQKVLKDINLNIKPGEKVAIVGDNGAGKTTLVKLISRMYLPSSGKILVDGMDLKDVKTKTYYENIGVLFQEFNRYNQLTVKENIHIGKSSEKFDEKRFIEALDNANALDFVKKLPNGYDQILTEKFEGGVRLSSGQWQKIAIARFFYRDSPLVIFDEPTSVIDAMSEYKIFNKIFEFFKDKTVILISHRFSTVRNADRIIVLKDGRIIEQGSHKELMEEDGYYAESFKVQAKGYAKD